MSEEITLRSKIELASNAAPAPRGEHTDEAPVFPLGRIVCVTGSKAIVLLEDLQPKHAERKAELGSLLRIVSKRNTVFGLVSALNVPVPTNAEGEEEVCIAELELVGELRQSSQGGAPLFRRGVTIFPSLGDAVWLASHSDLEKAYALNRAGSIRVGAIAQDRTIPASIRVNDLLGKHFAVLGATGTGKSCSVALIFRAIVSRHRNAHVVLIDPHNEYSASFGRAAEVVTTKDLKLPYWLFTFEEFSEILFGEQASRTREQEILTELIPAAKRYYLESAQGIRANRLQGAPVVTVDTPTPYKVSDVISFLDQEMGRLDRKDDLGPYKKLKARLEALLTDARYAFMFGTASVQDTMVDVLGRIFRIPVNGRPITIMDLSGVPSETVNVIVSVLARLTFDFAVWCDAAVPITLVCEEAHRYAPADAKGGFAPVKRALSRIAKEGRKYGVSLCIVSQRPSELEPTILSQCNTVFAMRMSNDRDQDIVAAAISDSGTGLLDFLPSLGLGEAIVFGEGAPMPSRLRFDPLPDGAVPKGRTAVFSQQWNADITDQDFLRKVVQRWREQGGELEN